MADWRMLHFYTKHYIIPSCLLSSLPTIQVLKVLIEAHFGAIVSPSRLDERLPKPLVPVHVDENFAVY
jgi:hypothetical protein